MPNQQDIIGVLESHGEFALGGEDVEGYLDDWTWTTADEVDQWISIGRVFDGTDAEDLSQAGLTPEDVAKTHDLNGMEEPIGYWVANGDLSVDKAVKLVKGTSKKGTKDTPSAIKKFWVVTQPTGDSELVDILFESNPADLVQQGRGGLDYDDVVGAWADKAEAEEVAKGLLAKQTKKGSTMKRKTTAETIQYKELGLGKFNNSADEQLYKYVLDGWASESLGEADGFGAYDLLLLEDDALVVQYDGPEDVYTIRAAILLTANVGIVHTNWYNDEADALREWEEVEKDYDEWLREEEDYE